MRPQDLKLYHSASSPNSRRVRIYLAEKGLELTLVPVDLAAKEQFSDSYKAINPRSVVPALVLPDSTAIGEVPAIWRYLEESFPDPPLLGIDPMDKALVTMWERRAELEGFAAVMEGVRNAAAGLKGRAISGPHGYEQIPALVDRSRLRVVDFYEDLDRRLAEVPFVAGERFSAADITALVTIDFATNAMKLPVDDGRGAVWRWYREVSSRASAKA
jgi:glutathione S-transferase